MDNDDANHKKQLTISAEDMGRRSFMTRASLLAGTAVIAPTVTACVDSDIGDPPRSDSDVSGSDFDPSDPVRYGDPAGARSDGDVGD